MPLEKANELLRKGQGAVRLKVRKCGMTDSQNNSIPPQNSIKLQNTTGQFKKYLCKKNDNKGIEQLLSIERNIYRKKLEYVH